MEAQQSHLRSTQQPTRMAETFSRNTAATWHGKTSKRTKCVQNNSRERIRTLLCRRSPIPWRTNSRGQTVHRHSAAPSTIRPTGDLTVGNTINFLGRNITNKGDYYEVSLSDKYTTDLLHEAGMANSKAAPAPGTKVSNTDLEQPLNTEEHKAYRRAVGKLQWMTYTRPDISYATKELARSLTEPTTADQQKLKHLLRYIRGTQHYKFYIRPRVKTSDITPDVDVYVDSDWAGCATTRKSTSGFVVKFMGAAIHFGSRTQSTTALSSAEAELYAINTGATEALHIRSFLTEVLNKKVNIRIYTDSSSGKSMATRIGSSKKAKHTELKHLFIQQLVLNDVVRILKINTVANPADIFTKYVATETLSRHLNEVGINTQPY